MRQKGQAEWQVVSSCKRESGQDGDTETVLHLQRIAWSVGLVFVEIQKP